MPDRILPPEDPTIPPPGNRTGEGITSILPFLLHSLAAKPAQSDYRHSEPPPTQAGDLEPPTK